MTAIAIAIWFEASVQYSVHNTLTFLWSINAWENSEIITACYKEENDHCDVMRGIIRDWSNLLHLRQCNIWFSCYLNSFDSVILHNQTIREHLKSYIVIYRHKCKCRAVYEFTHPHYLCFLCFLRLAARAGLCVLLLCIICIVSILCYSLLSCALLRPVDLSCSWLVHAESSASLTWTCSCKSSVNLSC